MNPLYSFIGIGPTEMIIVGIVAVLLFGNRLPEVGRSLGRGLIEFKKGLNGIEDTLTDTPARSASHYVPATPLETSPESQPAPQEPSAPQFTPPAE